MVSIDNELQGFYNNMNGKVSSLSTKATNLAESITNFQTFNTSFADTFTSYYKGKAQDNTLQAISAINDNLGIIAESINEKISSSLKDAQSIVDSTKQLIELRNRINNAEQSTEEAETTNNEESTFHYKQKEVLGKLKDLKGRDGVIAIEKNTKGHSTVEITNLIPGSYKEYKFTASNGVTIDYFAYVPSNIETTEGLPIHIHLWPSRANGGPMGYYNVHGLPRLLREGQSSSGVVICPKLEANEKYDNEHLAAIKELADSYVTTYKCDSNKISISGQGGGGQGAINMAAKYPEYFSKVISLYSLDTAYNYDEMGMSGEQAKKNIGKNDVTLFRCTGGGENLDKRSIRYTSELYSSLSPYSDIDVIENPHYIYGDDLFSEPFTYEGKTYANLLEYCMAQTREDTDSKKDVYMA